MENLSDKVRGGLLRDYTRDSLLNKLKRDDDIVQSHTYMNKRIRAIVIGLVLGDGYFTSFVGNSCRSRIDIKGDNKHLGYLRWLHKELEPLRLSFKA